MPREWRSWSRSESTKSRTQKEKSRQHSRVPARIFAFYFLLSALLLEVLVDERLEVRLRHRPDGAIHHLPFLEHDQRRDRGHAELHRDLLVLVDVHLGDDRFSLVVRGELFDDRADDPARSAPRRPEVDEDRLAAVDDLLEVRVGDLLYCVSGLWHLLLLTSLPK